MLNKRRFLKKVLLVLSIIIIFIIGVKSPWQYLIEGPHLRMSAALKIDHDDVIQLFYTDDNGGQFKEENSISAGVKGSADYQTVNFIIPKKSISSFRLDTGTKPGSYEIKSIDVRVYKNSHRWGSASIFKDFKPSGGIVNISQQDGILKYEVKDTDPYFVSGDIAGICNKLALNSNSNIYVWLSILLISVCFIFVFLSFYRRVWTFIRDILQARRLITELAKKDLKNRYTGSYLGIIWAFIQPLVTILIFWFVFQVGFKSAPVEDFPFILWLICGMVPWFFFSESLLSATNSVIDNSYLVKKVVFRVDILPIIRIMSALFIHLFFIVIIFIMFFIYGYKPSIYNLQVIYYLLATIVLVLGLSWITSALVVFLRDMGQIISIVIQFGFWLTPIFWSFKIMPEKYHFLFKLNPVYYIVEGYRDTFINHIWFWQHYNLTVNFWVITSSLFIIGTLLFRRLRPHFADVL